MKEDPAACGIDEETYEAYIKAHPLKEPSSAEGHPKPDGRESTLRNRFQRGIDCSAKLMYECCVQGSLDGDAVTLEAEKYESLLAKILPGRESDAWPQHITAMRESGLEIRNLSGRVRITCPGHEGAAQAMYRLANAPESPYRYMNFLRVDFRGTQRAMPQAEDVVETIPEKLRISMRAFDEMAAVAGNLYIKPMRAIYATAHWKGEYRKAGKCTFGFYADADSFTALVYFGDARRITQTDKQLSETDSSLAEWFEALFPERNCTCPNNRAVILGGKRRRICGLSNRAEIVNPEMKDMENIIRMKNVMNAIKKS